MKASVFSITCYFALLWTLAAGASIPRYFEKHQTTPRDLTTTQVQHELSGQVSNTTSIFGPDDGRFNETTDRWTTYSKPHIQVVVEPGSESDVAKIVQYCDENSIDFLALGGGHGISASLGTFNGIQISMGKLNKITIQPSGKSAWFEGGTLVGQVIQYLWDKGYVATTGGCECVGMVGAGLGGGHGRQEGVHGLIIDNMLQFNVVLGNGTAIRVNATSHNDLLWGMKGAGHNFGIVTSYEMNIFPRGPDIWHYHNYIWRGDQLEPVFNALNEFHNNGSTPVDMAFNVGSFVMNTTIAKDEPVLFWTFAYRGTAEKAEKLLAPINAIKNAYEETGDVPYTQVAHAQGTSISDPICQHGSEHSTSTAFLQVYNVTAERLIFDGFKQRVAKHADLAAGTTIMHEGYATKGVEDIDPVGSAYPFRAEHHLMLFNTIVPDSNDRDRERKVAQDWAAEVRDQWNSGQPERPVNAYVNYATGFETLQERYGHESWRVEKLRDLKAKYDPDNRFRYYNPIVVE